MLLITSHSNYHFLIIQYMLKLNYHVIIFHVVKNEHDASFLSKKKKSRTCNGMTRMLLTSQFDRGHPRDR